MSLSAFFEIPIELYNLEVSERYLEVTEEEIYILDLPLPPPFGEKFVIPLRSAKRCYCFGDYLATLELCAHLAEMLAQLIWESYPLKINEKEFSKNDEKKILGSKFEKMNQSRRLKVLFGFKFISNSQKQKFDEIRNARNRYFHRWSEPMDSIKEDAKKSFHNVSMLIKEVFDIELDTDEPKMNEYIYNYIQSVETCHGTSLLYMVLFSFRKDL